jgi:sensor c-di-GMP phosphodiesterase-like protein
VAYTKDDFVELLPAFKKALQLTVGQSYTSIQVWIDDSARRDAATGTTRVVSSVSGTDRDIQVLTTKIQADSTAFLQVMNEELSRQSLTEATLLSVTDAQGASIAGVVRAPVTSDSYTSKLKTHIIIVICFGTSIGGALVGVVLYASRRRFWVFREAPLRDAAEEREAVIRELAEDVELSPALMQNEVDLERAVSPDSDGLVNRRPRRVPGGAAAV